MVTAVGAEVMNEGERCVDMGDGDLDITKLDFSFGGLYIGKY